MAFIQRGTLNPHGAPILRREIIANSITVVVMDSVRFASGFVALGTTGSAVLGHVVSIGTDKGVGLNTNGTSGSQIGSYVNSFLTPSNNQTVGKVRAEIDISKNTLYAAELDAAIGTTSGSNLAGFRMDIANEETLDESTATVNTAQYNTWGVDPIDNTRALVNILESQVFGS